MRKQTRDQLFFFFFATIFRREIEYLTLFFQPWCAIVMRASKSKRKVKKFPTNATYSDSSVCIIPQGNLRM